LTVYGGDEAGITWRPSPKRAEHVGLQMLGPVDESGLPCETIVYGGQGAFLLDGSRPVGGLPTYQSLGDGGQDLVYHIVSGTAWAYISSDKYEDVSVKFERWAREGHEKIQTQSFSCACSDALGNISGLGMRCDEVYRQSGERRYANVHCADEALGPPVRRHCPALCGLGVGSCPTTTTTTTTPLLPTLPDGSLCKNVVARGQGLFSLSLDRQALGRATYWSYDDEDFIYVHELTFLVVGAPFWAALSANASELRYRDSLQKADLQCGCKDTDGDISGFDGVVCKDATDRRPKYSNVRCSAEEHGAHVRRWCPVTCGVEVC